MLNTTLDLGTDVATFLIYHPDDLAHRADAPLGWYSYDFAYVREAAAGRMVAIGTGADGGYRIRLTTGPLTAAEAAAEQARISSPYVVRHGRVFVDNTDGLPGPERMLDPDEYPNQWIELANGVYRVSVVEIDWSEDDSLPSYVVQFETVESLDAVDVPERFPLHSGVWGTPRPSPAVLPVPSLPYLDPTYPLLVLDDQAVVPGQTEETIVPRELGKPLFDYRRVVVTAGPVRSRETLGTVARIRGTRWGGEGESLVMVEGIQLVRLVDTSPGDPLPTVRVEAVERPDRRPGEEQEEALLAALHAFAQTERWASQPHPVWTRDRVDARDVRWPEAVRIALDLLDLSYSDRVALAGQPEVDQVVALTARLQDAL